MYAVLISHDVYYSSNAYSQSEARTTLLRCGSGPLSEVRSTVSTQAVMLTMDSALTPIGAYRATAAQHKRKQSKKRKHRSASASSTRQPNGAWQAEAHQAPLVRKAVLIGFNEVTSQLEKLTSISSRKHRSLGKDVDVEADTDVVIPHITAVFLLRPLDDLIYSHLPMLCSIATLVHPKSPATRLVLLDPVSEKQVADALGQQTGVSLLALLDGDTDAAGLKTLVEYVHEQVKPLDVPWLKEISEGRCLSTVINQQ